MADVKITKKPSLKVTSLGSPTRSGNTFKVEWKYPSDAKSGSKDNRFEKIYYQWNVKIWTGKKTIEKVFNKTTTTNLNTTSASLTLAQMGGANAYYPNTSNAITSITFKICGQNKIGSGPVNTGTLNLNKPPKPTISKSVNTDTSQVTFTIKTADSGTSNPRTHTQYWVGYKRYIKARTVNGQNIAEVIDKDYIWRDNGLTSTSGEFTRTINITDSNNLGPDDWIQVICKARSRGLRGASDYTQPTFTKVSGTNLPNEGGACHIFGWPATPTITGIKKLGQMILVMLKTNYTNYKHVVDQVELQRAQVDTGHTPSGSDFSSVSNAVDDAYCSGLSDNEYDARPSEAGKEVWYRIKATHDNYTVYSEAVKCPDLATLEASADKSSILSLSVNTNVSVGTTQAVGVDCSFTKEINNGVATSNSVVYSCAELIEPQTYASLDFSSETILTDLANGIPDSSETGNISWYIQNLTAGHKYVMRVCRALCSNLTTSPSVDSRGKWSYYTISDGVNGGVSANLLDATPLTVPSIDDILQEYLNSDSNIAFTSVGSQTSNTIKVTVSWYRGEYDVLWRTHQKGSDKSVLEYIKKGETSWQNVELTDNTYNYLDSSGDHEYKFSISGLTNGEKYKLRFKRVLQQGSGDPSVPSSELSSDYVYYPNGDFGDEDTNYITVFDPTSSLSGSDTCSITGVTVDVEKESMIVEVAFENTYESNGTQIMWSNKYPPKALTTASFSSHDVLDSDLDSSAIVSHHGTFSLIVDELPKGDIIYLDARRFVKSDSTTSYGVNYASGTKYSEQECAWSITVSSKDDNAFIDSLSTSSDGTTITITTSHEADDSDGTEISYSKRSDAWNTTNGPETYSMADEKKGVAETRTISVPDLDSGTRYYFKVRRYMDGSNGTIFGSYSAPKDIITPYPVYQDAVYITSIESEPDGQGLRLTLGWYDDSSNKTEISYSDYKDAWISSSGANTFEVVDADWVLEESETYTHQATAIIRDLEEGVKYYIRARRITSDDVHGVYTDTFEAVPLSAPDSVVLNVPNPIVIGQDFSVSWDYQAIGNQTAYILKCTAGIANVTPVTFDLSMEEGNAGYVGISWEDFFSKLDNLLLSANSATVNNINSLAFEVLVTTGGEWETSTYISTPNGWVSSGAMETILASPPTCSVTLPNASVSQGITYIQAQPMTFSMTTNMAGVMAFARIESQGVMQIRPYGEVYQPLGDCIWTEAIDDLIWMETQANSGVYTSSYTLPTLDFIQNGSYILYVTLYNGNTGLFSEEIAVEFTINWSHPAQAPSSLSVVERIGTGSSMSITPEAPSNYISSDLCDVYRVTQDRAQLIYEGLGFGSEIIDDYPPYSMHINTIFDESGDGIELKYRLVTRTVDGDIDFVDVPYTLTGNGLTLDWDNGSKHLELPWNVNVSNSYSKDFENRIHMDGTVTGYWNTGSTHTGSFDTVMCRIDCSDVDGATRLALCRELAAYTNPVFVRTPYGDAFCADVSVEISYEYNSPTATISLSYTEIEFTNEFVAR